MNSLRHQILQNRAAIDFLLLAHGHACNDFEGMCCFNLSSDSQSIHKQLEWLKLHTQKISVVNNPLDSWLSSLGFGPWLRKFIIYAIGIGCVLLMLAVFLPSFLNFCVILVTTLSILLKLILHCAGKKGNCGGLVD